MGIEVSITGNGRYAGAQSNIESYEVAEDSTPAEISDSSGATGQIQFGVVEDPSRFGSVLLLSDEITLTDGDRGEITGQIGSITSNDGLLAVTADSRLGRLVVDKDAAPVHDTFTNVFTYYLSLAGLTTGIAVDPVIGAQTVNAPGWSGDLWTKIKELCVAFGAEVTQIRDNIAVRPLRERRALEINNIGERWTVSNREMAKEVEVYHYGSTWKAGALVYPKGGWTEDVPIYTVDAGETTVITIDTGVSLTSVVNPDPYVSVPREYAGPASAYAPIGNDGLPITQVMWRESGGKITVAIGDGIGKMDMTITAPRLGSAAAEFAPFRIATADAEGNFYSSIRIMGDGIHYEQQAIIAPTAADELYTSRDIGVTVDNIFIATESQARTLALDAASRWAIPTRSLDITKSAINKPGDTDQDYDYATFADFDAYAPGAGITTFAQFDTAWSGDTFADFDAYWYSLVEDEFNFQVFGNANGARVAWRRAMWRIRSVKITADTVNYQADEDTTFGDFDESAGATPVYTWLEQRRNLFPNPRGTTTSSTYWGTAAAGTYSLITDMSGPVRTGVRWTRNAGGTGAVRHVAGIDMPDNAELVHYRAHVRLSDPMDVNIYARPNIGASTNQALLTTMTVPAGESIIDVTSGSFGTAASVNSGISVLINTGPVGATFDISAVLIEPATDLYTPLVELRRNMALNPSFEDGTTTHWTFAGASGTRTIVNDWAFAGTTSASVVAGNSAISGDYRAASGGATSFAWGTEAGKTYTLSAYVNYSAPHLTFSSASTSRQRRVLMFYSIDGVSFIQDFGPQVPNTAGVHRLSYTFTVPDNATGTVIGIGMAGSPADNGVLIQKLDGVLLEAGDTLNGYYDGATPNTSTSIYSWAGLANISQSILETRQVVGRLPGDTSYFDGSMVAPGANQRYAWAAAADASPSLYQTGVVNSYSTMTFADFDASFAGLTFADFALIPLPNVASQYDRF